MINLDAPEWRDQLPILSGPSLYLREIEADDADALFELLTDPQVSRYISPPPPSVTAFAGFIEWAHRQRTAGTCVCFAVVPKGLTQAIGLFQVRALEPAGAELSDGRMGICVGRGLLVGGIVSGSGGAGGTVRLSARSACIASKDAPWSKTAAGTEPWRNSAPRVKLNCARTSDDPYEDS